MIKRCILAFFMVLTTALHTSAQEYRRLDSLIALSVNVDDTVLPRICYDISWESRNIDPMLGIQYGIMSLEAADICGNQYYMVMAYNAMAMNERKLGHFSEALNCYRKALAVAEQNGFCELSALEYSNIGNAFFYKQSIDSAICYETEALRRADSINSNSIYSRVYMNMGLINKQLGNYSKAIEYFEMAYFIRRDSLLLYDDCSAPIGEMAGIYIDTHDYESAKQILSLYLGDDAIQITEGQASIVWNQLAQVYYKMGNLDSAAAIARQSLQYAKDQGNVMLVTDNYKLLDSIFLAKRDFRMAAMQCREFISICDTVFNEAIADQLVKIRYSSKYVENKRTIEQKEKERAERFHALCLSIIVLVLLIMGIRRIIATSRQAKAINADMDEKRAKVMGSIECAHLIQSAVMPDPEEVGSAFVDRFVLFMPRDIVSGDFYWRFSDSRYEMIAVADCTGHGVPGAMLTMLGTSTLQDIARQGVRNAGEALELLRSKVKYMMRLNDSNPMQDGMDISLIVADSKHKSMEYAGAFNSLLYVRDGEILSLKATRAPIGYYIAELPFKSQRLDMEIGDIYYLYTDGFLSQFGGEKGGKFAAKRFRKLLLDISSLPMAQQKEILINEFHKWRGAEEQVDDVTIVGLAY